MKFLLFIVLSVFIAAPASAAKRAFVLGNASYEELSDLRNTHADARAYADVFGELGYDVSFFTDLTLDETEEVFEAFLDQVMPGDEIVFVYSGHGWSDGGTNYLIPVDAPKQGRDRRLKRNSLPLRNGLNGVMDAFEAAGASLTVAIIDACRNNPFDPTPGTKSAGLRRGLAPVQAATGTFVIYSAGEGQEALDRLPDDPKGETLSVFTRSFIPHLKSGVSLERAISKAQVETAALAAQVHGHQQHPAYYDQTLGDTCLAGVCKAAQPVVSACDALYAEAREANACFAYDAYARTCPEHLFAPMADAYLARNCTAPEPTAQEEPARPTRRGRAEIVDYWDSAKTVAQTRMAIPDNSGWAPSLNEDGRHLVVYSKVPEGTKVAEFKVYDLLNRSRQVFDTSGLPKDRQSLIWSPERYYLIRASGDLDIYETRSNRRIAQIESRGKLGAQIRFNYKMTRMAVFWTYGGASKPMSVIETETGDVLLNTDVQLNWEEYFGVEFSPDGNRLALNQKDLPLEVWDLARDAHWTIDPTSHLVSGYMGASFFSADGARLLVTTGFTDATKAVLDIDVESGAVFSSAPFDLYLWPMVLDHPDESVPVRFAGTGDGYVLVRETDWRTLWSIRFTGDRWAHRTAFDHERGLFAAITPKGELTVHDLFSGRVLFKDSIGIAEPVMLGNTTDWQSFILATKDGTISTLMPQH